ncbi:LysM peptidoglycan-binding domain-containing protein [Archangium lansingense]|uniref:LysM peptidoglycan-binding domain-containing protein n=1 Tax=Archangium lansingense TaxID=2995310 RepID=A0ABT3ZVN3_9BACT|nr:LysM peptidoglycan-binding domain-containing protein [Archangium lansinium]MCY1073146.1 LysM peptidoglycan-binding domain-containing protein [Archangium lansinium]
MAREEQKGGAAAVRSIRHRLRDGEMEYVLLGFHEALPAGYEPVALGDTWLAERRLRELAQDYFNLRVLRELVYSQALSRPYEPSTEELVVRQAATLFARGHLRLARAPLPRMPGEVKALEKQKASEPPAPVEEKLRLMLQLVDDVSEEPVPDVKLRVLLSDGSEQRVTTDAEGRIELSDVPQGRVKVASVLEGATLAKTVAFVKSGILPSYQQEASRRSKGAAAELFLARVIEHKVSDGETLESVAESYGLTVDQLARFNWGTTDSEEIQRRLLSDVGCTSMDDSGKFVLSSLDEPGILYVARPLEMDWVTLELRHIWRVRKMAKQRVYLFSA